MSPPKKQKQNKQNKTKQNKTKRTNERTNKRKGYIADLEVVRWCAARRDAARSASEDDRAWTRIRNYMGHNYIRSASEDDRAWTRIRPLSPKKTAKPAAAAMADRARCFVSGAGP